MKIEKQIDEVRYVIDFFKNDISMTNNLALYSSNNSELIVTFVEKNSFLELLDLKNDTKESEKYFDWEQFIHPEDNDLFSYDFLEQKKSEEINFNFRVIKENKSIVILSAKLEKINFSSDNKTLVFNIKLYDSKSLLTSNKLEELSKLNFSSMLIYTRDFMFFKDLHHVITASSQTLANITGFSSGDKHLGLTDYDIFPKEHADKYYILEKLLYHGDKSSIVDIQPFYDEYGKEGWVDNRKYPLKDESGKIVGLFGIARIVTEEILTKRKLEETQLQLEKLATVDSLTQLFNRRHGYDMCEQLVSEAIRYKTPLSLIMFDIDYFKEVNDTYGHDCGDEVLIYIANIIHKSKRESDIAFRFGGEEFVICLPHSELDDAIFVMERINNMLKLSFATCINKPITVSSGIVQLWNEESFNDLIKRVDKLLYKAKNEGRNCIRY